MSDLFTSQPISRDNLVTQNLQKVALGVLRGLPQHLLSRLIAGQAIQANVSANAQDVVIEGKSYRLSELSNALPKPKSTIIIRQSVHQSNLDTQRLSVQIRWNQAGLTVDKKTANPSNIPHMPTQKVISSIKLESHSEAPLLKINGLRVIVNRVSSSQQNSGLDSSQHQANQDTSEKKIPLLQKVTSGLKAGFKTDVKQLSQQTDQNVILDTSSNSRVKPSLLTKNVKDIAMLKGTVQEDKLQLTKTIITEQKNIVNKTTFNFNEPKITTPLSTKLSINQPIATLVKNSSNNVFHNNQDIQQQNATTARSIPIQKSSTNQNITSEQPNSSRVSAQPIQTQQKPTVNTQNFIIDSTKNLQNPQKNPHSYLEPSKELAVNFDRASIRIKNPINTQITPEKTPKAVSMPIKNLAGDTSIKGQFTPASDSITKPIIASARPIEANSQKIIPNKSAINQSLHQAPDAHKISISGKATQAAQISQRYHQTQNNQPVAALHSHVFDKIFNTKQSVEMYIFDPRKAPSQGSKIQGKVIGHVQGTYGQNPMTIVQTPRGQISMSLPQQLPIDTELILADLEATLPALSRHRFTEFESLLGKEKISVSAQNLSVTIPQAKTGSGLDLLFFLLNLKKNNALESIFGDKLAQWQQKYPLGMSRLEEELSQAQPSQTIVGNDPFWQSFTLPLQVGDHVIKLLFYWHQDSDKQNRDSQDQDTEIFAVEGYHHHMGRFRLDGQFLRPQLNLQWASDRALNPALEENIQLLFHDYSGRYNIEGQLNFFLLEDRALWVDQHSKQESIQV